MLRLYLVEDGAGFGLESLILTRLDWPPGGEWANLRAFLIIDDKRGGLLIGGEADHEPPAPREEQQRRLALYRPDDLQDLKG